MVDEVPRCLPRLDVSLFIYAIMRGRADKQRERKRYNRYRTYFLNEAAIYFDMVSMLGFLSLFHVAWRAFYRGCVWRCTPNAADFGGGSVMRNV